MKTFKQFFSEGIHDPAKFKAIFLAGGPGSGKSYVRERVRGDLGFKVIDSDHLFASKMKKAGLSLRMPPEETKQRDAVREKAKAVTAKKMQQHLHNRQGVIIDGTGRDYQDIHDSSNHLRKLGYDTHMVFVNTSLDVAHARNEKRERSVPKHIVTKAWHDVQSNMGKFQNHFGHDKFTVVDNNNAGEDVLHKVHKRIRHIAQKPITSSIAHDWISNEMKKRNITVKPKP